MDSRSDILFYPNPEHEFEFYPILTRVILFYPQDFNFIHLSLQNEFYPFIQKLRRHPNIGCA